MEKCVKILIAVGKAEYRHKSWKIIKDTVPDCKSNFNGYDFENIYIAKPIHLTFVL